MVCKYPLETLCDIILSILHFIIAPVAVYVRTLNSKPRVLGLLHPLLGYNATKSERERLKAELRLKKRKLLKICSGRFLWKTN